MSVETAPRPDSVLAEIQQLRGLTVGQLREKWRELYGEDARSRNKDFLFRRLAWRIQELAYGGLSERARTRALELAAGSSIRLRPPRGFDPAALASTGGGMLKTKRDPRLPRPGTVITRTYHGRELRLTVRDADFELDGRLYGSLSEAARVVTGQRWNGPLFWRLSKRGRRE
jgi:hypothetical protein